MKIIFYIAQLSKGGAERVLSNIATKFAENNDVIVVTTVRHEEEYCLPNNISRYVIDEELEKRKGKKNFVSRNLFLRSLCNKHNADILISFMGGANYHATLATVCSKTKCIISVRNDPKYEYPRKVDKILAKVLLPLADGCVFQTEDAKGQFDKRLQKKSRIIFNAVGDSFYLTKRVNTSKDIVTVGRLEKQKNHELLIHAMKDVVELRPDLVLRIYGDGKLKDELLRLVKKLDLQKNVFLMGTTNNVQAVLSNAGIFVLSSDFEGMPNALMEAMAVGVPCISTDCPCGGPKMLLGNNENGVLVPVQNREKLSEAIMFLSEESKEKDRYRIMAKNKAEEFKMEKVFECWDDYVKSIVSK